MKKCNHCQKTLADDIYVCDVCGGTDFEPIAEQSSFNPYNYVPYQGEIKAKMKPGQIALIVLGCVAIILTAFFAVKGVLGANNYTKGETSDGVYLNEWAEMKLVIPEGFDDLTSTDASDYQDSRTDCGLVIESENTSLVAMFENISGSGISSSDEYIDILHDDFSSDVDMKLEGMSVSEVFSVEIADKQYKAFKSYPADKSFHQYICVRKQDNRAVVFIVTAIQESQITDILSQFEPYTAE